MDTELRQRVQRLSRAIHCFKTPGDPIRERLCSETPHMSPETMARGLDVSLQGWNASGLLALWEEESPHLTDAVIPRVVGVVLGGVLPPSHLQAMAYPLFLGARIIVKPPQADPLFTDLFRACYDDDITVVDRAGWQNRLDEMDAVIAVGDDASVRQLSSHIPLSTPFVAYGHRTAIALVDGDAVDAGISEGLARDVGVFDQLGCLSPQEVFVVGSSDEADTVAWTLADHLALLPPRRDLGPSLEGAIRSFREMAIMRGDVVHGPMDLSWGIVRSNGGPWTGTPGGRHVVVRHVLDHQAALVALDSLHGRLSAASYAGSGIDGPLRAGLIRHGASRIVPVGRLQCAPPNWPHDGQRPLAALCRWVGTQ